MQQAAELQILRANVESRRKAGDNFYKMDAESITSDHPEGVVGQVLVPSWIEIDGCKAAARTVG